MSLIKDAHLCPPLIIRERWQVEVEVEEGWLEGEVRAEKEEGTTEGKVDHRETDGLAVCATVTV